MTSSHHNPDERDLLDYADAVNAGTRPHPSNDLERTYLHVQRTMQGESAAIPPTTKQSTWEDVMSTLSLKPEAPVSNRTRRQQHPTSPPPAMRPRRIRWSPLASIAAAALVIIASFGVWQINQSPTVPPLAPHLAGVPAGDVSWVWATPQAGLSQKSESRSIPIIQHVDEQPTGGPVIWLTNAGDVMYDDGTGEVQTLASEVTFVQPYRTNILMFTRDGEAMSEPMFYHMTTGESLGFRYTPTSPNQNANLLRQLDVIQNETAPNLWSVMNFDTMQWITLNELTGGQFPSSTTLSTSSASDGSAIAVASSQYQTESSSLLMQQSGLPAAVAVIPADLSEPTWVKVPPDMPPVGNMSLSTDGSKIAFISADYFRGGSNITVAVVDVGTGDILGRTQRVESESFSHFQWVNSGSNFVIVSDKTVQLFSLDGTDTSEPTVIYETEGALTLMPQFGQSNLLHLQDSAEEPSVLASPETSKFVILNTSTQENISIDGQPWFQGLMFPEQMTFSLAPIPVSRDGETAVLVHPITGEVYPDLFADVRNPFTDPGYDPNTTPLPHDTVTTAFHAPVSAVRLVDGNLAIFNTSEESFAARVVERPENAEDKQIMLSASGDYLTIGSAWETQTEGSTFWMLELSDPDAVWVQGEPGQMLAFIEVPQD